MNHFFHFRKPFENMSEKEYQPSNAIVMFGKYPEQFKVVPLSPEQARKKGHDMEKLITQYKCFIRIDLWFAVLEFDWLTDFEETNNN